MNRWLLPEGIEEVLAGEALAVESLRRQLLDLFDSWGYDLIIPPVIEFTDSLLTGMGADLDLQTIKVTDRLSGKTMGLRADMSPQAARIDARNGPQQGANRLCYAGTLLQATPNASHGSRSPIQIGAELFGVEETTADLEIILLMIQTLALVTDQEITLDMGHAGLCQWLRQACSDADLPVDELYELIQSKRLPELDAMLAGANIDNALRDKLKALPLLIGDISVLDRAEAVFADVDEVIESIDELRTLTNELSILAPDVKQFFDLGEMRGTNYHTGVVFAAFVEYQGVATRIANGGRYNEVGAAFGRARPATGFSADLKRLVQLQGVGKNTTIVEDRYAVYAPICSGEAAENESFWHEVAALRADGVRVILGYEGDGVSAESLGCQQQLTFSEGEWHLRSLS